MYVVYTRQEKKANKISFFVFSKNDILYSMKKLHMFISLFAILLILGGGFWYISHNKKLSLNQKEKAIESSAPLSEVETKKPTSSEENLQFTEEYFGVLDGKNITLTITDYTTYALSEEGAVALRTGEVNTERGFGDDENATVYVLDYTKVEKKQTRFVRLSNDSTKIFLLENGGTKISTIALTKK